MTYSVKEIFLTLQGEGAQTGMPAVFLRLSGCNLWTGREEDREKAICRFCDTDFVGTDGVNGGKFREAGALAAKVASLWEGEAENRLVVVTGGEPTLQLDEALLAALHAEGFRVAVESNGTMEAPTGIDWLTISPKARATTVQKSGNELKLVFPQEGLDPESLAGWDFTHFFLQPMDGPELADNIQATIRYCLAHPHWRLSLQTHKITGIP